MIINCPKCGRARDVAESTYKRYMLRGIRLCTSCANGGTGEKINFHGSSVVTCPDCKTQRHVVTYYKRLIDSGYYSPYCMRCGKKHAKLRNQGIHG